MSIIRCCSCQKAIHIGKNFGSTCIFCGTINSAFSNSNLEGALQECINKIKEFIEAGKFEDAIGTCNDSIETYPNISELYWLRCLAHYNCKNDMELIQKGINIKKDSDFICCMHFADSLEKDCLEQLCTVREAIVSDVIRVLVTAEKEEKIATGIKEMKKKVERELAEHTENLRKQIIMLDIAEKELRDALVDCYVLINSRKQRFNEFLGKAEHEKEKIDYKTEVTDSEKATLEIALDKYVIAATTEFGELKAEEGPCFERYRRAKAKQDKIEKKILEINAQISYISNEQNDVISAVNAISKKYAIAKTQMETGDFSSVMMLTDRNVLTDIFNKHIVISQ